MYSLDDDIAAVASASGGALRGIVRAAGPRIVTRLEHCFRPHDAAIQLDGLRRAAVISGTMALAGFAAPLECDVYLWPSHRSYTRSPSAEIHTLGSPPILEAVLSMFCAAGVRPARPGEFTLRAFLAGRIDLTQAEAVLGVIDAGNQRDFYRALEQLAGGLAAPLAQLRGELLDLLAHLEAGLDFVEEDIEFITAAELERQLGSASERVDTLLDRMTTRSEAADLVRVVLIGWPNVGKSSLFNALAGRDSAIVSHVAGTTRDYLTVRLDLDGIPCELIDTAGVELLPDNETIPGMAQASASEQRRLAHVELLCLDATRAINDWERAELSRGEGSPRIMVWTKADRGTDSLPDISPRGPTCHTSSADGTGLAELRQRIRAEISNLRGADCQVMAATALRSRESLRLAAESLHHAREIVAAEGSEELVAAEMRSTLAALGEVVGAVYTDDILDRIFSRFCIGK